MPPHSKEPVLIAGTGRVAQALGRLLAEHGEPVVAIVGRTPESARSAAAFIGRRAKPVIFGAIPKRAARVLIAVSDSAITEVAARLAADGFHHGVALHTCGAVGAETLAPLAAAGVSCGALHPLQTFATPEQGLSALPGCLFAVDGDGAAIEWAGRIAHLLGGETLAIPPASRLLYHAAAVMASNYVVALVDAAAMLMSAAGVGQDKVLRALAPLIEASARNATTLGPVAALTGPIQRGDLLTLSGHMRALARGPETVRELYRWAGLHALDMAVRRGLPEERARPVEELLRGGEGENG
ncbi:MAG TPA: DUF2520 domain-containing protein [Bryobacteraceae bacterium]|nr:DUF2520 domain-containing protein [Bryobacteraceae bacterium]